MPGRSDLRGFLRREVLRSRIRPPSSSADDAILDRPSVSAGGGGELPGGRSVTVAERTAAAAAADDDDNGGAVARASDRENGELFAELFGEDEDSTGSRLEARGRASGSLQARLEQLLSQAPAEAASPAGSQRGNPALEALRDELRTLVVREADAAARERGLIYRQRSALILEIGLREAEERGEEARGRKARLDEGVKTLPEPIGVWEKRRLKRDRDRATKAVAGLERTRKKRRLEDNPDNDLDGEERLRLGKTSRTQPTKITGHWHSALRDGFPMLGAGGAHGDMAAQELLMLTRRLARYDEELSSAQRGKRSSRKQTGLRRILI